MVEYDKQFSSPPLRKIIGKWKTKRIMLITSLKFSVCLSVSLSCCVSLSLSFFSLILLNFLTDDYPGSCVSCVYVSLDSCFYYKMTPCELDLAYKCKYIPYLTSLKKKQRKNTHCFNRLFQRKTSGK